MQKTLAQAISVVFYPILVPVMALAYLFYFQTPWFLINNEYKTMYMLSGSIVTTIVPLLYVGIMIITGTIKDIQMTDRSERLPNLATIISVIILGHLVVCCFAPVSLIEPVSALIMGEVYMLVFALLITPMSKISLHTMGIGAMFAFVVVINMMSRQSFAAESMVMFGITGLVAWARLKLDAHTSGQLLAGFGVGVLTMLLTLSYNLLKL